VRPWEKFLGVLFRELLVEGRSSRRMASHSWATVGLILQGSYETMRNALMGGRNGLLRGALRKGRHIQCVPLARSGAGLKGGGRISTGDSVTMLSLGLR